MGKTDVESEIDELVEGCVDLLQKYVITPDLGKLNSEWLRTQLRLYERDLDDFCQGAIHFTRFNYDKLKKAMPRDVCSLLNQLVDAWCVGGWDEPTHSPMGTEINMYLVLANHFWFDTKGFSHLSVIEKLEDVYEFMVDRDDQYVPGIKATMSSKERRKLRDKAVRKYIRGHPEVKKEAKQ